MVWWLVPAAIYGVGHLVEYLEKKKDEHDFAPPKKPTCPKCNTVHEEGKVFCKIDGERLVMK